MENNINEELDAKKKELEHYQLKSKILQIERICIVRNCIGKLSAQLIAENVDRNIACRPAGEIDIEDVSEVSNVGKNTVSYGLDSKLMYAHNYFNKDEDKQEESVS